MAHDRCHRLDDLDCVVIVMNQLQLDELIEILTRQHCDKQLLDVFIQQTRANPFRPDTDKFECWQQTPEGQLAIDAIAAAQWSDHAAHEVEARGARPRTPWPTRTWRGKKY